MDTPLLAFRVEIVVNRENDLISQFITFLSPICTSSKKAERNNSKMPKYACVMPPSKLKKGSCS